MFESECARHDYSGRIVKADLNDLKEILQLQYLAYQSEAALFGNKEIPPLKQTIEEVVEEYEKGIIIKMLGENDNIIGSIRASESNGTVYIGKLMVHPDYRKRGYGRALLAEIEKYYPGNRYELFTSTRSSDNIRLYQLAGYKEFSREKVDEELEFVFMEKKDSICIKLAETDEELCGRGYVHCTAWQEAYRGIVCDRYLDTMTVEATTARARQFPENTLVAKDKEKVVGFAVYGRSRDEDLPDAGEVVAIYVLSEYYGRKIGYRLMNEAFSRLKEYDTIFVWVLEKNERAIDFYHKYGFEFDGSKKEWNLGTPVSIVRMIKKRD